MTGTDASTAGSAATVLPGGFLVRRLGRLAHAEAADAMRAFTDARTADTSDELWLCEHPPTFTLGQAARREHVRDVGDIPLVPTDRGGQVTYHGPGQIVIYTLVDLRRRGLGVRAMVEALERAVVRLLAAEGIGARGRPEAPGVYVGAAKVAALGLRVRRGCSYHGLAFNADMDLGPFARIDPCGHPGLEVVDARTLGVRSPVGALADDLLRAVARSLEEAGTAITERAPGADAAGSAPSGAPRPPA